MKRIVSIVIAVVLFYNLQAQKNPTLKFKITGVKDTTIFLANYYGNKLYYSDTVKADAKGNVTFGLKKKYEPGVYAVVVPGNKYFEIVVNNENIIMETDTNDFVAKMVVKASDENKLFYDYIKYINDKKKEADPLREKLKPMDPKSKEADELRKRLNSIDKDVRAKQVEIYTVNPNRLISKVIKISIEPEIPEAPKNPDGSLKDSLYAYKYLKAHYWDNFDFSDRRLVRCPFFHNRIENYFKNMVAQTPDSMIVETDRLIQKIDTCKEMFKYVVHYLTYTTESSKIMCMDAAFVHIAMKYYKTGQVFWLDKDKVKKITDRAEELAPITCNTPAHNVSLLDTAGKDWIKLYSMNTEYTILIFWDPECGHCKKEMPKFAELYKKWKDKGVSIYAVSSDNNDKWRKFIRDNKMEFVNVAAPAKVYENQQYAVELIQKGLTDLKSLNYRTTFDVYSTPKVFLLDKNKKILAKQLEADQVEKILDFKLNQ